MTKRNIDAWWPLVEAGAEALLMTASGCGQHVKDYGRILARDPDYADKVRKISGMTQDLCEVLRDQDLGILKIDARRTVAFHPLLKYRLVFFCVVIAEIAH